MKRDKSITWNKVDVHSLNLNGFRVAVIGGTGGIGRALSQDLARQGADVTVVGQTFRDAGVTNIRFLQADLSLMKEAARVAEEIPAEKLDVVVFTTGIMAGPKREATGEAIERDFAISYLSRYVILHRIASRIGKTRSDASVRPRMYVMGFPGSGQKAKVDDLNSEQSYGRMQAHMNTVAGNEVLVTDAASRYPDVDFYGLNPGFVKTNIRSNLMGSKMLLGLIEGLTGFMTIKPEVYSERIVPLLVSPDIEGKSGAMFNNKAEAILPSAKVAEAFYTRALVEASERLVGRALESSKLR